MQFAQHVNIEKICAEMICGLMAMDTAFYEFGEIFNITEAGAIYVKCSLPKDIVVSEHLVTIIKTRLTKDFTLSSSLKSLIVS